MARFEFRVVPDAEAPVGAPLASFTNIERQVVQRPLALLQFIEKLTGEYSPFEMARIDSTWLALYDGGFLENMDVICLLLKNEADSLLNWTGSSLMGENEGASFSAKKGFTTDGATTYLKTGVNPNTAEKYSRNSASFGMYIEDSTGMPSDAYILGLDVSGDPRIALRSRHSSTGALAARVQSTTSVTGTQIAPQRGAWVATRTDANNAALFHDNVKVAASGSNASSTITSANIVIGRQSTTYSIVNAAAWFVGAGLNDEKSKLLASIMDAHVSSVATW